MNSLLESEIGDERLDGIWITAAELSPDGARVRLWYTIVTDEGPCVPPDVPAVLQRAVGYFRRRLCDALSLKRTPELRFSHDPFALAPADVEEHDWEHE